MKKLQRDWVDPVQIFIDRQLAAPWREHQLYKDVASLKGRSWAWCPVGRSTLYVKEIFSIINKIEDELIAALDKKYHGKRARVDREIEFILEGYKIQEIADMLGISRRTVWLDLSNWRFEHSEEDEERLREITSCLGS